MWTHANKDPGSDTDREVLQRWTMEAGLVGALENVKEARDAGSERASADLQIVYGGNLKANAKL